MIITVSYPLSGSSPLYPGTPELSLRLHRSMDAGDPSSHSVATVSCHAGTHIDTPSHFCPKGATVRDALPYGMSLFPAYCCNLPRGIDARVTAKDFEEIGDGGMVDARAILLRTGFFSVRNRSDDTYTRRNPVVEPGTARYLRSRFPNLRLFGIDAISIASPDHRDEGRECHREFLCRDPAVLILEDADLADERLTHGAFRLTVYPVFTGRIEATPVVALAEIGERDKGRR